MPESPAFHISDLPSRLGRLPWSRFHTRAVIALGITWLLDGLEVTLAGAVADTLKQSPALHLSNVQVGIASSAYLIGAVFGALLSGWMTDRLSRRKLFFIALGIYILVMLATVFSWSFASLVVFRVLTGAEIGGEYAATNSTIQELMPARVRGWTDLAINGTFWVGAVLGADASRWLLDPTYMSVDTGWRLCFFIGALLGFIILVMRSWIPRSLRWLITRGRHEEAQTIAQDIENEIATRGHRFDSVPLPVLRMRSRDHPRLMEVVRALFVQHRQRALVGLALMTAQVFFYSTVFFTYALALMDFYDMPTTKIGTYLLPFAPDNFLGPLLLGRLFDVVGRRTMIVTAYAISGVLLLVSGTLFKADMLDGITQTLAWTVVLFFTSAAASSAYLTASEAFSLEARTPTIALFYAAGTGLGGVTGPALFGWLIDTHSCGAVFGGYAFGAVLVLLAAAVQACWRMAAERKPPEHVAAPLSVDDSQA